MHFSASFGPITSIPICAFQGGPSHFSAIFGTNHSTSRISGYCKFYRLARPFSPFSTDSTSLFCLRSNRFFFYLSLTLSDATRPILNKTPTKLHMQTVQCTVFKQIKMHIGNIRMFKFCDLYCYTVQLWLFV